LRNDCHVGAEAFAPGTISHETKIALDAPWQ
jgi:hypothetical protein